MTAQVFVFAHSYARKLAADACRDAPDGYVCRITPPGRSLEQNDRMWAMLSDISRQVEWPVNGRIQLISAEDWKNIFSSSLKKESRVAQGIDGGFVLIGQRTSRMSKKELSDLMELISAFGAERNVKFGENQ